ncbi:hypothetical protein EDB83DRAFT_2319156 [Lactarius deliciosus]|nr:hypothetical protein EDB83DRAFT_2319156 [Lactarius deliciosus]
MDDQVDLSLVEPVLHFPMKATRHILVRFTPSHNHGCQMYHHLLAPGLSSFKTLVKIIQRWLSNFCLPVKSVLSGSTYKSTYKYTASSPDGGNSNILSTGSDASSFDSLIRPPRPNVPAAHTNHPKEGSTTGFCYDGEMVDVPSSQRYHCEFSGNLRPSTENRLSDYSFVLPQRTLQDQELLSPVSIVKRVFDISSSFHPLDKPSGSLETQDQDQYLEERPAIGHRGQYLCKICGDGFAQPQGVRQHHLEKHEPKTCPHCHTFKWGHLYLFKKHLWEAHPYEDTEPSTPATAKGGHRKSLTTNKPELQPASSLESQAETISIIDNNVRDEACVICEMQTGSGCLSTAAPRP